MRAGKDPWPPPYASGSDEKPGRHGVGQVRSTVARTAPNHPLVRVRRRRHHQSIILEVADAGVEMSPSEVLRLISDLEKLAVTLGWLEAR